MCVLLLESEALLNIIKLFHLLGEHISDDKNLLGEALVLVNEDLLIFEILVLFFFHFFCCFNEGDAEFLSSFL